MSQNWQYLPANNQPGAVATGGGGGWYTGARDQMDFKRMGYAAQIPSAQYPDGYLGTINSRREDRVLNALKQKLGDRSYQRGVHKGEKVDASEYFWPADFNPATGLEHQLRGKKWTAKGTPEERLAHGGKNAIASPQELGRLAEKYGVSAYDPAARKETDPNFAKHMRGYLPPWR
ncbi:hypothetical protein [Nonomuraea typhae]|uniref:Uncharacterized protein n=1 Tax=Nonomuraea typhae TaxID=2603600 RepID=A0ABW7YJ69_9ACTN